jgi:hypothetical protein
MQAMTSPLAQHSLAEKHAASVLRTKPAMTHVLRLF